MSEVIVLAPDTIEQRVPDLPRFVRLTLGFTARLRRGTLEVTLPDGRVIRCGGAEPGPSAAMTIHSYSFAWRFAKGGDIGIAESYLRREWDTPNLTQFLYLFCVNHDLIQSLLGDQPLVRVLQNLRHWFNRNTKRRARKNIYAHYDIGNDFYSAWLDPSMTYSSALFEDDAHDLTTAQHNKYRRLAEAIDLRPGRPGTRGLADAAWRSAWRRASARDPEADVDDETGLPALREEIARHLRRTRGLAVDPTDVIVTAGTSDALLLAALALSTPSHRRPGRFWPQYFAQLRDRLQPGGLAGVQAITIQDRFFHTYRREVDFIQRYVFPGGMLPSPHVLQALGEKFGVPVIRERIFGLDYARTLASWRDNFRAAWPDLTPLGFDERFRRLWEYYLAYCEAGFLSGNIDVRQVVFAKTP